jgi:hypothetical protein
MTERIINMRKLSAVSFLLLFTVFSVFPETVFVHIKKGNFYLGNTVHDETQSWINSLENGIMDTFFENGHIVFSGNSGKFQDSDFDAVNRIAKAGGASILVTAVINLSFENNNMETSGDYSVYNLFTDDIMITGKYDFDNDFKNSMKYVEEKMFETGKSVGTELVKSLF